MASNISDIERLDLQRRIAEMQSNVYHHRGIHGGVIGYPLPNPNPVHTQVSSITEPKAPSMDDMKALGCYWRLLSELPELLIKGQSWWNNPNGASAPLRVEIQHRPDINETYVLVRVPPKTNEGEFFLAEPYRGFPSEELITKLRLIR